MYFAKRALECQQKRLFKARVELCQLQYFAQNRQILIFLKTMYIRQNVDTNNYKSGSVPFQSTSASDHLKNRDKCSYKILKRYIQYANKKTE